MTKTWETLFHLSNFMKFLLHDVLPKEKSTSPQYVLDSLLDLLQVVFECIHDVRDKNFKDTSGSDPIKNSHELIQIKPGETVKEDCASTGNIVYETMRKTKLQEQLRFGVQKETHVDPERNSMNHKVAQTVIPPKQDHSSANNNFNIKTSTENQEEHSYLPMEEEIYLDTEKNCVNSEPAERAFLAIEGTTVTLNTAHIKTKKEKQPDKPRYEGTHISPQRNSVIYIRAKRVLKAKESNACAVYSPNKKIKNKKQLEQSEVSMQEGTLKDSVGSNVNCNTLETVLQVEENNTGAIFLPTKKKKQQKQSDVLMQKETILSKMRNCENLPLESNSGPKNNNYNLKAKETIKKISSGSGMVTRHKSLIIKKDFIFLNEQIVSGSESYGAFCLPCDKGFFSPQDWHFHLNDDYKHLEKSCGEISCEQCDFHICGIPPIAGVYLDFHAKSHSTKTKQIIAEKSHNSHSDLKSNELYNPQDNSGQDHIDPYISVAFRDLHTEIISDTIREGYYCGMCDLKFFMNKHWLYHLDVFHQKVEEMHIVKCSMCSFVIYSSHRSQERLMSYHLKAHESRNSFGHSNNTLPRSCLESFQDLTRSDILSSSSRASSNMELNLRSSTSNLNHDNTLKNKCKKGRKSKTSNGDQTNNSKEFVFSNNFIKLDEGIHNGNITEAFYCRPCEKVLYSHKDWENHCKIEKHTFFMKNRSFHNSQAKCCYCKLTLVGSQRVVREYMKYHSNGHGNVPSYEQQFINCEDPIEVRKDLSNTGSVIEQDLVEYDFIESKNKQSSLTCVSREEATNSCANDSWYHKDLTSRIEELFLVRRKEKLSGKIPSFVGKCLVCEYDTDDAFEWIDHLELDRHCSNATENDKEIVRSEFNIHIFGNKKLIEESYS